MPAAPSSGGLELSVSLSVAMRVTARAAVGVPVAGVAEESQVVDVGCAVIVQPLLDVVGVAAVDSGAAFGAASAGDDQRPPLRGCCETLAASLPERLPIAVEDVPDHLSGRPQLHEDGVGDRRAIEPGRVWFVQLPHQVDLVFGVHRSGIRALFSDQVGERVGLTLCVRPDLVGGAVAAAVVSPELVDTASPGGQHRFAGGFVEPGMDLDRSIAVHLVPPSPAIALTAAPFLGLGRGRVAADELAGRRQSR